MNYTAACSIVLLEALLEADLSCIQCHDVLATCCGNDSLLSHRDSAQRGVEVLTALSRVLDAAGQNADYTIVVQSEDGGQEEIPVHRMLLEARSPFFRGMLESNMAEAQEGRYVVRDIDANVFKALLHFIYTGETNHGQL
jgi:hypothetical protein